MGDDSFGFVAMVFPPFVSLSSIPEGSRPNKNKNKLRSLTLFLPSLFFLYVIFMCSYQCLGRVAVFAGIADILVRQGDEGAVGVWYATHPSSMLSVVSVSLDSRGIGWRFPFLDSKEGFCIDVTISRRGVELNQSSHTVPISAAVAQIKLLSCVARYPPRLHISCTEVIALEELFLSLEKGSCGMPAVIVARLQTNKFSYLLDHHKRLTGRVLSLLRTVRMLSLEELKAEDGKLNDLHELRSLRVLSIAGTVMCSLSPLRGMQTLTVIYITRTAITDNAIRVLSQLVQLRRLMLEECKGVVTLAPFTAHPSLQYILAMRCDGFREFRALTTIPTLEYVKLSLSVVGPEDMARCMEAFKAPAELILDGIRFSPVRVVGVEEYRQLRTLSLRESVLENYEWIARATYLAKLDLSATRVKAEDLAGLCRLLFYLETLLVCSCKYLSTSLNFLLPLNQIRSVSISNFSLLRNNGIALLRKRGVLCDVS
ncbi:hypothetical protein MOQ_001779 [Trypanosoma cruzi marinkellei]|uniref:Leucine-rich repeat protein (LRRP) n=1 Tax=Trypanosoma cruzi marinkellei TaxID=85056 RepID=K2MRW3_TRYCR|nr:hypothetical protein MOQ_001779 [Trypanosoma cruzi marinkellei]